MDADIRTKEQLRFRAPSAQLLLDEMGQVGNSVNILILDACRDLPLADGGKSLGRGGLAELRETPNVFIAYATAPNQTAADGTGTNSPFTAALAEALRTQAGEPVSLLFEDVSERVRRETGVQRPRFSNGLGVPRWSFASAVAPAPQTPDPELERLRRENEALRSAQRSAPPESPASNSRGSIAGSLPTVSPATPQATPSEPRTTPATDIEATENEIVRKNIENEKFFIEQIRASRRGDEMLLRVAGRYVGQSRAEELSLHFCLSKGATVGNSTQINCVYGQNDSKWRAQTASTFIYEARLSLGEIRSKNPVLDQMYLTMWSLGDPVPGQANSRYTHTSRDLLDSAAKLQVLRWASVTHSPTVPTNSPPGALQTQASRLETASPESAWAWKFANTPRSNDAAAARLQRVASKLVARANLPIRQWDYVVFDGAGVGVYAIEGKVGIDRGLLSAVSRDDQLAAAIAHQLGHIVSRHGEMRRGLVSVLTESTNAAIWGFGPISGAILPYSRGQEFEADRISADLMHRAGYDVREAVRVVDQGSVLFSSDHPGSAGRAADLRTYINSRGYAVM